MKSKSSGFVEYRIAALVMARHRSSNQPSRRCDPVLDFVEIGERGTAAPMLDYAGYECDGIDFSAEQGGIGSRLLRADIRLPCWLRLLLSR
jgi:hypothetical protein